MIDMNKYLPVRWLAGGRVWPFLDCYGVALEVRRDLGLPEWPDYSDARMPDVDRLAEELRQTKEPGQGQGAVAFCWQGPWVTHVAVLVMVMGQLMALECSQKHNVTVLPLSRFERRFTRVDYLT